MSRRLVALLAALGIASSASAATITLDTDAATYAISDTITVTMVVDVPQVENWNAPFTEIIWNGGVATSAPNSTQDVRFTAFNGNFIGVFGTGTCLSVSGVCVMINQILETSPVPIDPTVVTATLLMHADAIGTLGLEVSQVSAFGLGPGDVIIGANASLAQVVPEPGTAALLGLGLLGLASAARERRRF